MVSMIPVKCPACGANVFVEDNKEKIFCNYCGTQIIVDNSNVTKHYRYEIDEAEIKKVEAAERVKNRSMDIQEKRNRIIGISIALYVGVCIITGVITFVCYQFNFEAFQTMKGITFLMVSVPIMLYLTNIILKHGDYTNKNSLLLTLWIIYTIVAALVFRVIIITD